MSIQSMELDMFEKSKLTLLKYSEPMMIVDSDGQTTNQKYPPEIRSKIFQCKKKEREAVELQNLLNSLIPPIEWKENGSLWQLQVSTEPVTRFDVIRLKELVDFLLKERQARSTGICSVRRDIYVQLFDEMIRQETIICPERGMLLIRMRDEHILSLASYQALYEGSILYAKSKAIEAEESVLPFLLQVEESRRQRDEILKEVKIVEEALLQSNKRSKELLASLKKRQSEQLEFLNNTNAQLKYQLEDVFFGRK